MLPMVKQSFASSFLPNFSSRKASAKARSAVLINCITGSRSGNLVSEELVPIWLLYNEVSRQDASWVSSGSWKQGP